MAKKETKDTKFYVGIGITLLLLIALFVFFPTQRMQLSGSEFMQTFSKTSDAVLLDVRTPTEFAAGHIDQAINVDYEDATFESEIKKLDPSKTYFVYCRSGNRSGKSITIMRANGFQHIYELAGGVVSSKDSIKLIPLSI
ncbi:MAG TPA: rhodanese-like domain-containing protein [Candidatus Paceibacterota bacterium]|nr:rhodanese-like domain-containing protein [Candidatus Paceibacterota bacterium]